MLSRYRQRTRQTGQAKQTVNEAKDTYTTPDACMHCTFSVFLLSLETPYDVTLKVKSKKNEMVVS